MPSKNSSSAEQLETISSYMNTEFGEIQSRFIPLLLWLGILAWVARITIFVRQRHDFSTIDVYAGVQILIVLFVFLMLFLSQRIYSVFPRIAQTSVSKLLIYYLLCAGSAMWSPMPLYTLYRAFEFIILFMGVLIALSYSSDFVKAERRVLFVSTIVILLTLCMTLNFGGFSSSLQHWHTTSYSASAAMLFCYCLGEYFLSDKSRRRTLRRYGSFAFCALLLGTSSASYIAVLCGIVLMTFLYRKFVLMLVSIWILIILFLLEFHFGMRFSDLTYVLFPGKSKEAVATLHGRIPMWTKWLELVSQSPIWGHGFGVISSGSGPVFKLKPHNSLFSVLLGTGLIGAIAIFCYLFRLLREFWRTTARRTPGAIGCCAAIGTGFINSLSSPFVFDQWEEATVVFACMMAFFVLCVFLPHLRQKAYD